MKPEGGTEVPGCVGRARGEVPSSSGDLPKPGTGPRRPAGPPPRALAGPTGAGRRRQCFSI